MTAAEGPDSALYDPAATRRVVLAVALGASLIPLNSTMLFVALPHIVRDLGASVAGAGWLVTGYLIAVASLQTLAGKLGDRYGHRGVFRAGLVGFLATSAAAAVAPDLRLLLVLRFAQGMAVSALFPNGMALLRNAVPAARRAAKFGLVGSVIAGGVAVGPPLGGLLVDGFGWRAVFLVNLVLAAPALWAARRIPDTPRLPAAGAFDLAGAIGWALLLFMAAGLLNLSTDTPILLSVGVPAIGAGGYWLVRRSLDHPDPVFQPRFFASSRFTAANVLVGGTNLAWYLTLILVSLALETRPGMSGLTTGLVLFAPAAAFMALSPLGGRLSDRRGRRWPAVAGTSLFVSGLTPLVVIGVGMRLPFLVATLTVVGSGLALAWPSAQAVALEAVSPRDSGAASGVYSTSRYLGSILGSSLLAAVADPTSRGVFAFLLVAGIIAALAATRFPGGATSIVPDEAPAAVA
ncbi:MAG: MFS transporter [Acidimicrobiia bacterium]